MILIPCPHCGPREQTEFTYGGDAGVSRPGRPEDADDAAWIEYLYLRDNPKGEHVELWQHTFGCRQWLRVRRNVVNHEIVAEEET
ncbi:MAG: sarcosine oxidase subunit delta [Alphaproteobacteria bacterium]|jgi:heterotetrameric sarcosine oxidase delta subunit|nr:sarcosine oxidase subunit delta [Alphaproteobacteria bacterium]MDP6832743.1 sarcosine oxidase subunit delta [Alphaproteobacteria bacterium]MDP6875832.1 sarcosine oxidase subunit delta [Alphaproteobacteria bacterium]